MYINVFDTFERLYIFPISLSNQPKYTQMYIKELNEPCHRRLLFLFGKLLMYETLKLHGNASCIESDSNNDHKTVYNSMQAEARDTALFNRHYAHHIEDDEEIEEEGEEITLCNLDVCL